mmetsp:Transcript_10583/g.25981  ORF Transcript_10583/g.25981 Transcript_10583/m.25981 type:complete len:162 (-) Transcript_10583:178-663(-)
MPKKGSSAPKTNWADDTLCHEMYGVKSGDSMVTPLGVQVQIVGMDKTSGGLYAEFPGGFVTPLSPKSKEDLEREGYRQEKKNIYESIMMSNKAMEERLNFNRASPLMATTVLMESESTSSEMVKEYFLKTKVERDAEREREAKEREAKAEKKKGKGKGKKA